MRVVYADACGCASSELGIGDFEPVFLDDEAQAVRAHLEAELRLSRGDGRRYYAFHVRGRHVVAVSPDR